MSTKQRNGSRNRRVRYKYREESAIGSRDQRAESRVHKVDRPPPPLWPRLLIIKVIIISCRTSGGSDVIVNVEL
jgi:hypothetical protein